jgi:hypothetical protein
MNGELSQVEDAAIFFVLGFQERHPATDGDWGALCCPWTSAARITAISGGSRPRHCMDSGINLQEHKTNELRINNE